MKNIDIYDIEVFPNLHTYTGISKDDNNNVIVFEISERKNDIKPYINYLRKLNGMIGYNNVAYDYPVLHYILINEKSLINLSSNEINKLLYEESQRIINADWSSIPEWNVIIPQLDLFLIKHYNNPARSTSLKWLEFTLRWNKLQDLPFKFNEKVKVENIQKVITYNLNDVLATLHFMNKKCLNDIIFRKNMTLKLNHNVMNYSDVKIGEHINKITYEKLSGRNYKEFKNKRTYRSTFNMIDIIPDNISFKTKQLQSFLDKLKKLKFKEEDNIDELLYFGDTIVKFAKGGLHSEDIPRIVKCKEGHRLTEKDIASMYPWTIISDSIYPQHLGIEWNKGIKQSYDYRTGILKPQLKKLKYGSDEYNLINSEQEAYKLSLNGGGFGKLGSSFSWQFDPLAKYKTTIGGELKMLMLIEDFFLAGFDIISVNTDGVVIMYPKEKQNEVDKIHKEWEKLTTYILEDTFYKQIIFSSVNDYIAEIIDIKTGDTIKLKFKGDFEIDPEPHKNNSQRIVPIALKEYFINGVEPRDIISNLGYKFKNSKNKDEETSIYDYCIGKKRDKNQLYHYVEKNKTTEINDKVIRYYIVDSNKSQNKLFKEYLSGKRADKANGKALESMNKGFNHMLFMDYEDKDDYMINYIYYIQECIKIIDPIKKNTRLFNSPKVEQLNLF